MKVKRTNKMQQVIKSISDLGDVRIMAGWVRPGQKHGDTKLTMAQLAYVMEYGAKVGKKTYIPPRPMLRLTGRLKSKSWVRQAGKLTKSVLEGKAKGSTVPHKLGALIADDIKGVMNTSILFTPNAPSTVRKKGKNTPLLDTLELVNAVWYEVNPRGK
nr:MAG TPA: virion morphogenesis protein [Caudoviricetes sp.]